VTTEPPAAPQDPSELVAVSLARLDALEALHYHAASLLRDDGTSTVSIGALAGDVVAVAVTSSMRHACACTPRLVRTAADIRALGQAVADGDPDAAPDGVPMVILVEDCDVPRVWTVVGVLHGDPGDPPTVYMTECWGRNTRWLTDRATDDGIAGHGPWRVAWSRGVQW